MQKIIVQQTFLQYIYHSSLFYIEECFFYASSNQLVLFVYISLANILCYIYFLYLFK